MSGSTIALMVASLFCRATAAFAQAEAPEPNRLYVKSADATWAFGWRDDAPRLLPLSLGLGYVIVREGSPSINVSVSGAWMAYREDAPIAAQTTVRFAVSIAFPQLKPW